jgi:hypothetical protein
MPPDVKMTMLHHNFFALLLWFAVRLQNDDERAKNFAQGGLVQIRGKM